MKLILIQNLTTQLDVSRTLTSLEINILHIVCELERTHFSTILPAFVKNPQLAGFLQTQNRSNFFYVDGSRA